jgi:hypothetical protein
MNPPAFKLPIPGVSAGTSSGLPSESRPGRRYVGAWSHGPCQCCASTVLFAAAAFLFFLSNRIALRTESLLSHSSLVGRSHPHRQPGAGQAASRASSSPARHAHRDRDLHALAQSSPSPTLARATLPVPGSVRRRRPRPRRRQALRAVYTDNRPRRRALLPSLSVPLPQLLTVTRALRLEDGLGNLNALAGGLAESVRAAAPVPAGAGSRAALP